jgi:hypothetical protein
MTAVTFTATTATKPTRSRSFIVLYRIHPVLAKYLTAAIVGQVLLDPMYPAALGFAYLTTRRRDASGMCVPPMIRDLTGLFIELGAQGPVFVSGLSVVFAAFEFLGRERVTGASHRTEYEYQQTPCDDTSEASEEYAEEKQHEPPATHGVHLFSVYSRYKPKANIKAPSPVIVQ